MLGGLLFLLTPLGVLVAAGAVAARQARPYMWRSAVGLVLISTLVWLGVVGLYQHETPCNGRTEGCPTVYGYDAPLPDEHFAGMVLMLAGFAIPAVWVGARRSIPPATAAAALALGPTALAWWTAPRGDNDGLWVLIFWALPIFGGLAGIVAAVSERIITARARSAGGQLTLTAATMSDRLAALIVDIALIAVVLVVPLTWLSDAKLEVLAGVGGVAAAATYLGLAIAVKGHSIGQSLVGLLVVDARTKGRVPVVRALLRSVVVVIEVALVPTLTLAVFALIELMALGVSGVTLTDRLFRTSVLSERRPITAVERKAGIALE